MSDERQQGGLSIKTLLIAATASAAAAVVVPLFWRPGTVFAAAMTPIIVTIVSELLKRPAETVSVVRPSRRTAAQATFDPLAPPPAEELDALPPVTVVPRTTHRRRSLSGRQVKLAVGTGLAAFAVAAAAVTASDLVAGDAISGGDRERTTLFGGRDDGKDEPARDRERDGDREAARERTPSAEPTATPTGTATPTPTATPEATATPLPTATPPALAPTPGPSPAP